MNIDLRLELPEDYRESLILYRNLIMSPFRRAFPDDTTRMPSMT